MFGWEFPPFNSGGLGTACLGLTKALCAENVAITFVLPKKVDVASPFARITFADRFFPGVTVKVVNSLLKPYVTSETYQRMRRGEPPVYGLSLLEEVKLYALRAGELAAAVSCDVIHAHDWLSFGAGLEAKRVSGKPLVVHVHATEFDRSGGGSVNREIYELEKRGMQEADAVIAVSNFTKRAIVDRYGIHADKVFVVHNGIDEASGSDDLRRKTKLLRGLKAAGKKIVLFLGRITLQKGPDYFLRAAKRVLEIYPDVYFVIAGSGDMERQIMRETASLGISNRVIFAGFVRGNELTALYRNSDLYVMPSVSEPFGLTALEAVQNGTPVIVSKQSGVSEVVNHCVKVDFWDIDAIADAIVGILYHRPLRRTMRENASRELRRISWQKAALACIAIYIGLVNF